MNRKSRTLLKELLSPTPVKKSRVSGNRPSDQRPVEPSVEEFGLSLRKLEYFQDTMSLPIPLSDVSRHLSKTVEKIGMPLIISGMVGLALYTFISSFREYHSWVGSLIWTVVIMAALIFIAIVFFIVGILILMICSIPILEIFKRLDPHFSTFRKYSEALKNYYTELYKWERKQETWWRTLDGRRFEIEMALFLKERGFHVQWTGRPNDGGVDLILEKDGKKIAVQCKAHNNQIGPAPVRDLYGTLIDRGLDEAWLISTLGFSINARNFAQGKPIRLVTISDLINEST